MFEMTLSRANTFYNIANAALVLGAMLVLLGTIVAIWTGGIRERFGDERLSNNETETARANESAGNCSPRGSGGSPRRGCGGERRALNSARINT